MSRSITCALCITLALSLLGAWLRVSLDGRQAQSDAAAALLLGAQGERSYAEALTLQLRARGAVGVDAPQAAAKLWALAERQRVRGDEELARRSLWALRGALRARESLSPSPLPLAERVDAALLSLEQNRTGSQLWASWSAEAISRRARSAVLLAQRAAPPPLHSLMSTGGLIALFFSLSCLVAQGLDASLRLRPRAALSWTLCTVCAALIWIAGLSGKT